MAKKPPRQWIFSIGLPDQARKDWALQQSNAVIFDALDKDGSFFSRCTNVSNFLPYYWTDLARAIEGILRRKNTSSLSETEESEMSLFNLRDLICRPARAFQFYKEYPSVTSVTSGEFVKHLTERFDQLVQDDFVRFQTNEVDSERGLALILNDQTDEDTSIRDKLFELYSLFQWVKGTSCEKSRNVDFDNKDEIYAVTWYTHNFLPQSTRFVELRFCINSDNSCLQAYKKIWESCEGVTAKQSAFDAVVVPMFLESPSVPPQTNDHQHYLYSLLCSPLQLLNKEKTIVLLVPSQLLVDRSLKSLQDVSDFFTGQMFDCALFKNQCEVIIKSYKDPGVKTISMLVIEIHRTVSTDRRSRCVGTLARPSATLNPNHLRDGSTSTSVHVLANSDDKDSSFGACSVEANEEADESDMDNTSVAEDLAANESSEDTKDDEMDYASSSSQPQSEIQAFTDIIEKVLSPETWASSDKTWPDERENLGLKRTKRNSRLKNDRRLKPLFNFLKEKKNAAFLARKREGEQLTWIEWALRSTVASKSKGVFLVTELLLIRGKFTNDEMFPESLLMTCLKQPQPWCQVVTILSNTFEIRPDERDDKGQTVLHLAVQRNLQFAVENICNKSPKMKQQKDKTGKIPLNYAIELQTSLEKKRTERKQKTGTEQAEAGPAKGPLVQIAKIIATLRLEEDTVRPKRHSKKQTNSDSKRKRESDLFDDLSTE